MALRSIHFSGLLAGVASLSAFAQTQPQTTQAAPADAPELEEEEGEEEAIVVTGRRPRGAVLGDIPPEVQLSGREVRALGAGSLAEVLEAISPQTRSGRGRGEGGPVILLNGQRISGFSEIRDIPPEAIVRVDIFPEEVALRYGYRADQRVVNFVLRRRFRAYTGELEGGLATGGGRETQGAETSFLKIGENGRLNLAAEYQHSGALLESDRDLIQANPVAGIDVGDFRTLLPETDQLSVNGTLNRRLGRMSGTLNARLEGQNGSSLIGLPHPSLTPPGLDRETESRTAHLGLTLQGPPGAWQWSLTGNLDRVTSDVVTETSTGRDLANSISHVGSGDLVVNGALFELPAGSVSTTLRGGVAARDLESRSLRGGTAQFTELDRQRANAQVSIDLPIASRRRGVLSDVGNLSLNANAEVEHLSDFGTLRTLGAGLNWSPIEPLSFILSFTDEDGSPSMQQLGDPTLQTPGARVFDFVRGETSEVTLVTGGNPNLIADNRRVWKLGATLRPLKDKDLSLTANYTVSKLRNPISSFPAPTAAIEAAFPERFERDSAGRLIRFDSRPVNFARAEREELRGGINFSKPLGPQPQPGQRGRGRFGAGGAEGRAGAPGAPVDQPGTAAPSQPTPQTGPRQGGPGAGGGRPGGGGGFRGFGGGGGRGGRLQLAFYHTWRFTDEVLIRPGLSELDYLEGAGVGSRGGRPRHEIEVQTGLFKNGLGARLTGNWQSSTFVRGGTGAGGTGDDLFFSDFATLNLRLFADLGQQRSLAREHPFLRGMRVSLAIDNVLDTRQQVRDELGQTPLNYQPGYLDPLGRSVRLSLRKLFF
ncbi:MAG TPA: TonB-dependent receptor [Allosphingosinicella sp.]